MEGTRKLVAAVVEGNKHILVDAEVVGSKDRLVEMVGSHLGKDHGDGNALDHVGGKNLRRILVVDNDLCEVHACHGKVDVRMVAGYHIAVVGRTQVPSLVDGSVHGDDDV